MQKWYIKQLVSSLHESARSEENHWYCCHPNSDIHSIWYATGKKLSSLTTYPLSPPPRMLQDRGLSSPPGLLERVLELKDTHCSPYLLAFLFDCYEDALENSNQKENVGEEERKETLRKALEVRFYQRKLLQLWFPTLSVGFEGSGLICLRDELKMLPLLLFSYPFCVSPPLKDLWTSGTREGHHP